ncbi:uncharacterized protein LOC136031131 isoform X1 [Artemia franciscana]|uniref:TATA box binding protein associated factor (TAF) histone-like fold domain-containing protein n=1 Tax=Artemia franciscana TaxID=6661 RepID=A0AA88KVX7_ARTSF|nr:hypothetical protein QYM36_016705 [Artemia franciscana]
MPACSILDLDNVWEQYDISDSEIQKNLGEDATFRVKQILELASSFMQHGKRKALLTQDVQRAMKWLNLEPVYGHSSEVPIFEAIAEADAVVQFDQTLNLYDVALSSSSEILNIPLPYLDSSKLSTQSDSRTWNEEDFRSVAKALFDENQEFVELVINSCGYMKNIHAWRIFFREVLSSMTLKAFTAGDEVLGRRIMHLIRVFFEDFKVFECDYAFLNSILTPLLDMESVRIQAAAFIARLGEETFIRKRLTHAVNVPEREHINKIIPLLVVMDPLFASVLLLYHFNEKEIRLKFFTQLSECPLIRAFIYRLQKLDVNAQPFIRMQAFLFALQRDSHEGSHTFLRFSNQPLPARGDPFLPTRLPVTSRPEGKAANKKTPFAYKDVFESHNQYLRPYRHFYMVGEHVRALPIENLRRRRRNVLSYQQSAYQFIVKRYCKRKNGVIHTIGPSKACGFDLQRVL